ncbi:MAG TPA: class I SAM-dependent methyltransferase [Longimicrobiales bacterium]|nr:class I SAM-dependent methyltransferase [Longimicrobiales bacterium]
MDVLDQIEAGCLVCPRTRRRLVVSADRRWLSTDEGAERYALVNERVPILHLDPAWAEKYAGASPNMTAEYQPDTVPRRCSNIGRFKRWLLQDHRSKAVREAFAGLFESLPDDALCISVGGGPLRSHPLLTNLNLGPFPNVDVVADAHRLPYADACVRVIYSEAVFEHLYDPATAASEINRVLRPGGKAMIHTPFLQAYHGYPHHYQNFTLTGHQRLFESAGLRVMEAGAGVGPVFTIVNLISVFLREYTPRPLNHVLRISWTALGTLLVPLDRILGARSNAHVLASTTYVVVEKPHSKSAERDAPEPPAHHHQSRS